GLKHLGLQIRVFGIRVAASEPVRQVFLPEMFSQLGRIPDAGHIVLAGRGTLTQHTLLDEVTAKGEGTVLSAGRGRLNVRGSRLGLGMEDDQRSRGGLSVDEDLTVDRVTACAPLTRRPGRDQE